MLFMQPEIWEDHYWAVETNVGTEIIPIDVWDCGAEILTPVAAQDSGILEYLEGNMVESAIRRKGWLCRLTALGYLDCTDTSAFETEAKAIEHLLDMYGGNEDQEDWETDLIDKLAKLGQDVSFYK